MHYDNALYALPLLSAGLLDRQNVGFFSTVLRHFSVGTLIVLIWQREQYSDSPGEFNSGQGKSQGNVSCMR